MEINQNLLREIEEFPDDLKPIAKLIFKEIDKGKSKSRIQDKILAEIREVIYEKEEQ